MFCKYFYVWWKKGRKLQSLIRGERNLILHHFIWASLHWPDEVRSKFSRFGNFDSITLELLVRFWWNFVLGLKIMTNFSDFFVNIRTWTRLIIFFFSFLFLFGSSTFKFGTWIKYFVLHKTWKLHLSKTYVTRFARIFLSLHFTQN